MFKVSMLTVIFPYYLHCVETGFILRHLLQDSGPLFCVVYRSRSYILSFSCESCIKLVITAFSSNSECREKNIYIYIHTRKTCRCLVKLTKYYTSSIFNVQHEMLRKCFLQLFVCTYTRNISLQTVL